jgi:hypothetical protein
MTECETNLTISREISGIYLDVIMINQFINKSSAIVNNPLGKYVQRFRQPLTNN